MNDKELEAISLATIAHKDQVGKIGKEPYILHPFAVATIIKDYSNDDTLVIAGLLHDVIEDCPNYSLEEIEAQFGSDVANIIKYVTELPKTNSWYIRKKDSIKKKKKAPYSAKVVYAADKIHNLTCLIKDYQEKENDLWSYFNSEKEEILWYYENIVRSIGFSYEHDPIMINMNQKLNELIAICNNAK